MELDELKYQLKNKLATDHTGMSDTDIAAMLTKKTASTTGKLKKSLWFEIISGSVAVLAMAYVCLVTPYHTIRIYFSVFAVLFIALIILLVYLLRRVSRLSASTLPVKSNLQTIVKVIEEFTTRYFQFTLALIPICFVFVFILSNNENLRIPAFDHFAKTPFDTAWKVIAFLVIYFTILTVGIWYFTKWYLRKLYGIYVAQLKECISELGE
jgi:hypothetical protein